MSVIPHMPTSISDRSCSCSLFSMFHVFHVSCFMRWNQQEHTSSGYGYNLIYKMPLVSLRALCTAQGTMYNSTNLVTRNSKLETQVVR